MHDATTDWRAKDGTRLRASHPNRLTALDLIKTLLDHGADPNKPYDGQMHSASMCCDTHANGTPFYRAAVAADVEALKLMVAKGADLEWAPKKAGKAPPDPAAGPNNSGKTPLMVAMDGGKGVGMAGGPGDIREGAAAPFRELSNRNPPDAMQVLIDAVMDAVPIPDPSSGTWSERLWQLNRASRKAFAAHPGAVLLVFFRGTDSGQIRQLRWFHRI